MSTTATNDDALLGQFSELREEALHLQRLARRVADAADTAARLQAAASLDRLRDAKVARLDALLGELAGEVAVTPALRRDRGETLARVRNWWMEAKLASEGLNRKRPETYRALAAALDDMVLTSAYVTVPPEVARHLAAHRVGASMDFSAEFKETLPDEKHRTKVFDWIYRHPASVPGVVDAKRQVIFKAAVSPHWRVASVAAVVAFTGLLTAVPWLNHQLGLLTVEVPWRDAARAYALALVGAGAHLLVAQTKAVRRAMAEGQPHTTLGNALLWVHVRYLSFMVSAAMIFAAAVITMMVTNRHDPLTMLAAGYSADSVIDLALPRMTSMLTKRTEVITKAMA